METGLRNRVAIIAGSSQGLGLATAEAFAAEGTHLALCARNQQSLEQVAASLRKRFEVQVHAGRVDVRNSASIHSFVEDVARRFDRIDVCVTNAGGPPAREFLEASDAEWDDAFAL